MNQWNKNSAALFIVTVSGLCFELAMVPETVKVRGSNENWWTWDHPCVWQKNPLMTWGQEKSQLIFVPWNKFSKEESKLNLFKIQKSKILDWNGQLIKFKPDSVKNRVNLNSKQTKQPEMYYFLHFYLACLHLVYFHWYTAQNQPNWLIMSNQWKWPRYRLDFLPYNLKKL